MGKCKRCDKNVSDIHTCSPTEEYKFNLLLKFVGRAYDSGCSLIDGVNCLSCAAKDVLNDLGLIPVKRMTKEEFREMYPDVKHD